MFLRDGQCFVRDLDSTNGTFVDGARVVEAVVSLESRVRIGNTELCLHTPPQLPRESASSAVTFGEMVGISKAAKRVFAALRSVSASSLSCLLLGETGTGKELAARALHEHSARAGKPFLVVDCPSVGAQFIEDKLFGHERGAFTGATSAVAGVFEEARGGTVFLDEIGELPLALQAKLLGVLERREATRIGSHKPIKLDMRLVAATHRDPARMAKYGEFRQDLLYRISEFTLRIPPLRERKEEVGPIALAMLNREGQARSLSADAIEYLSELPWPGNVRELRNVVERAVLVAGGPEIRAGDLALGHGMPLAPARTSNDPPESLEEMERRHIDAVLHQVNWHQGRASDILGISAKTLYRKMRDYGLRRPGPAVPKERA
jgi:DNA-binding NtrC family response regulator